jgi:hypothetical protein
MEKLKTIPKPYLIGGAVVIVLILVVGIMSMNKKPAQEQATEVTPTEEMEAVIPTVDPSVKVSLEGLNGNKEVELTIAGVPKDTTSVDYELSYLTRSQGTQGAIGTISVDDPSEDITREITLGTCSSGKCVYHEVEGSIKVTLKFTGEYGEQIFEKEFEL